MTPLDEPGVVVFWHHQMVFGHLAQTHVYVCLETNPRTLLLKFAPLQITDPG